MNEIKIFLPCFHAIFLLNSVICASLLQLRSFFKRFRTLATSDCLPRHVCPSGRRVKQLGSRWTDFREVLYNLGEGGIKVSRKFKFV